MITGTIELDGFAYSLSTGHPLIAGPGGAPVPDTSRLLRIVDVDAGPGTPTIRIIFSEEDWETFKQRVAGSSIEIAQALPRINGGG